MFTSSLVCEIPGQGRQSGQGLGFRGIGFRVFKMRWSAHIQVYQACLRHRIGQSVQLALLGLLEMLGQDIIQHPWL